MRLPVRAVFFNVANEKGFDMRKELKSVKPVPRRFPLRSGEKIIEIQLQGSSTGIDIWSGRAAAWAQVLTLVVVVVGYFYTVVPAFQRSV